MNIEEMYKKMLLIRETEKAIEDYFEKGKMRGTTHGYIGQEAIAVGVLSEVDVKKDYITSGHRCHGHYLALNDDVYGLACEIMGKKDGIINGKGASQHITFENFYTNGITGGMIPVSVGFGLSKKLKNEEGVVISFLGDGAMNEGYVFEALNLSVVYNTPNIFILENNNYAMSTDTQKYSGSSFKNRIEGLGLKYTKIKALDVMEIQNEFKNIYEEVKKNNSPYFVEFETFRFCGHSKSDKKEYFDKDLYEYWLSNDPLKLAESLVPENTIHMIKSDVRNLVTESFLKASIAKEPDPIIVFTKA